MAYTYEKIYQQIGESSMPLMVKINLVGFLNKFEEENKNIRSFEINRGRMVSGCYVALIISGFYTLLFYEDTLMYSSSIIQYYDDFEETYATFKKGLPQDD